MNKNIFKSYTVLLIVLLNNLTHVALFSKRHILIIYVSRNTKSLHYLDLFTAALVTIFSLPPYICMLTILLVWYPQNVSCTCHDKKQRLDKITNM